MFSPVIGQLIEALTCLPGVGRKSAQRMAFHLLQKNVDGAKNLAETLVEAVDNIQRCEFCNNLTEVAVCHICSDQKRQNGQLCVVETAMDLVAIENTHVYRGRYFVLHGHLSPIDGIDPEQLAIPKLLEQAQNPEINELILATNLTIEGEATAHFIEASCQQYQVVVSRIAHGVPLGGELEYVDGSTLMHAFSGRK